MSSDSEISSQVEDYSDSSDSEIEEKRCWMQERVRGRGVTVKPLSEYPSPVGKMAEASFFTAKPFAMAGVGRVIPPGGVGVLPGGVVIPQQKTEESRLLREEAATESRLVRKEAVVKSPMTVSKRQERSRIQEVPVAASRERSRSREVCPVTTPHPRMARISRPSGDVEVPRGRKDFRDSLCPVPGCGTWTRKMKDHAFKSHLSHLFKLPVRVTGVNPVLFRQLGEALETVGRFVCGPVSGANDLMSLVNSRIRFPRQCTIPSECTLAMREVDIAMGWELVVSPQLNPLNNPSCLLHWRVLLTTLQWLNRTQRGAVREYLPVLSGSVSRYVPPVVPVAQVVPTCVVEEPEDWQRTYADTQVSSVASQAEPQPFLLRDYRTGQRVGVMANSIRSLQTLALQHFALRDPVLATDGATRISSDGYLMSFRRDAWVVAVPRDEWDRLY